MPCLRTQSGSDGVRTHAGTSQQVNGRRLYQLSYHSCSYCAILLIQLGSTTCVWATLEWHLRHNSAEQQELVSSINNPCKDKQPALFALNIDFHIVTFVFLLRHQSWKMFSYHMLVDVCSLHMRAMNVASFFVWNTSSQSLLLSCEICGLNFYQACNYCSRTPWNKFQGKCS